MKSHIFPCGRGRLIIGEHPDSLYITTQIDDCGVALFIKDERALLDIEAVVRRARHRIRAKG